MKKNHCEKNLSMTIEIRQVKDLEVAERTAVSQFIVNKSARSRVLTNKYEQKRVKNEHGWCNAHQCVNIKIGKIEKSISVRSTLTIRSLATILKKRSSNEIQSTRSSSAIEWRILFSREYLWKSFKSVSLIIDQISF